MKKLLFTSIILVAILFPARAQNKNVSTSGNPVFPGWYADPEIVALNGNFWIFPTWSAPYEEQVFLDAYSSPDLVNWKKHARIIDTATVKWARMAMWAPSVIEKGGRYYLLFGANDIQSDNEKGGIGIAVSDKPEGPYKDYLGKPLVAKFYNGAQPIDQFVFKDFDGQYYLIYGGWKHCNIARLNNDFTGFVPFPDGQTFKEITPENYVEGPCMYIRNGKYYFMWSEGGWTGPNYSVAYAISDNPMGPFRRIGKILEQDTSIASGAGHHSLVQVPGRDEWYIAYHRRPKGDTGRDHRETCIEKIEFDDQGFIKPVRISRVGVKPVVSEP
jgi:beta-xylosidase